MAIPTYTRKADGSIDVILPAGTKDGQFEVRLSGHTKRKTTRASTVKLYRTDELRSGRSGSYGWATGCHNSDDRTMAGVQDWERQLGRWMDLVSKASIEPAQGWGDPAGKVGDKGMAWNIHALTGNNTYPEYRHLPGLQTFVGMSIIPHKVPAADGVTMVTTCTPDSAEQEALHDRIVAGEFDWVYKQIGRNLVSTGHGKAIVRIDWEANATWYPHGTKSVTKAAKHGRAVARAASQILTTAPDVRFALDVSSHVYTSDVTGDTGTQWLNAYNPQQHAAPGQTLVHCVVVDLYFMADKNIGANPTYDAFKTMVYGADNKGATLGKAVAWAAAKDIPVHIAEWGVVSNAVQGSYNGSSTGKNGCGDAPVYIDHMIQYIKDNPIIASESYWRNSTWDSDLQTDVAAVPNSIARYMELMKRA